MPNSCFSAADSKDNRYFEFAVPSNEDRDAPVTRRMVCANSVSLVPVAGSPTMANATNPQQVQGKRQTLREIVRCISFQHRKDSVTTALVEGESPNEVGPGDDTRPFALSS